MIEENDALRRRLARLDAMGQPAAPADVAPGTVAYFDMLESAGVIALEIDARGLITHAAPSVQSLLGYAPEEIRLHGDRAWVHQDDREHLVECLVKLFASGDTTEVFSCRVLRKDGRWRMIEVVASPYRTPEGDVRIIIHLRDISAASELDLALRTARERNRLIDEMSQDVVLVIVSLGGDLLWANSGLKNLMGYSLDDFDHDRDFVNRIHPDDRERVNTVFYETLKKAGDTASYEPYRLRHKDGSYGWYSEVNRVYESEAGELQVLCVMRDVTAVQTGLQELLQSEERYRMLDELSPEVILIQSDGASRAIWANESLSTVLGYRVDELEGLDTQFGLVHPDHRDRNLAIFEAAGGAVGQMTRYPDTRCRHKDGSWLWATVVDTRCVDSSGNRWVMSAIRDISKEVHAETDRRLFSERLHESQRLESLGLMAGGVAHDFNNLLTPIVGETSLALMDLEPESPLRKPLLKIQKAAHRAAALTNQMLAYSGQDPLLTGPVDLSKLVEEMADLLTSNLAGRAELSCHLAPNLPPVEGDSAQLSQIVMNLISNAVEAGEAGTGPIVIRTGVVESAEVDSEFVVGHSEVGAGPYVFLEVVDEGCGMKEETRLRIFDPFFTTKFTGRGLGLASVVGIVRGHKGLIVLDSEVGRGTRFQVLLQVMSSASVEQVAPPEPSPSWRGDGLVLVVDDDEGVRELAELTLQRAGLRVLLARDGREGLKLFQRHVDDLEVVVLDRTMPGIGGDEVFSEIRRLHSGAAVILLSGYSEDKALDHIGKNVDAFLHKPSEPSELLDAVRRVAERRARQQLS